MFSHSKRQKPVDFYLLRILNKNPCTIFSVTPISQTKNIWCHLPGKGCKERVTGVEPAALGLGSRCSTTELYPQSYAKIRNFSLLTRTTPRLKIQSLCQGVAYLFGYYLRMRLKVWTKDGSFTPTHTIEVRVRSLIT